MPEWIKTQSAGTGTDWDNPIQRLWRKDWFAYGPRATQWWAKWREWPVTLFAIRSKEGMFRTETETYDRDSSRENWHNMPSFWMENNIRLVFWNGADGKEREITRGYLSAVQYWTKWHIALQWPLQLQFHYYLDDVPKYPEHAGNRRVIFVRIGARRDADKVYWFPSIFIGLQWN
jgi:hypothetical protein